MTMQSYNLYKGYYAKLGLSLCNSSKKLTILIWIVGVFLHANSKMWIHARHI